MESFADKIKRVCGCKGNIPYPFIDHHGNILSNEVLNERLKASIEREDFEDAAILRDELKRRGVEK